jgi:hypothetical protein
VHRCLKRPEAAVCDSREFRRFAGGLPMVIAERWPCTISFLS